MEPRRAPPLAIVPPPVLYAAVFLAGMGLSRAWNPSWMGSPSVHRVGWAILIVGLLLNVSSAGLFVFRRTTLNPTGQPAQLVTSGAHAWSRNPMYVGLTLVYVGAALALGQILSLALVVLPWATMNWMVIPFEEARLRITFGQAYDDYCRRVRRWL